MIDETSPVGFLTDESTEDLGSILPIIILRFGTSVL